MSTTAILRHRRGTASAWTTANPILEDGQVGFETDTLKFKLGDGATAWNSLAYAGGAAGVSDGDKGDIVVSSTGATWTIDTGVVGTSKMGGDVTTAGKNLLTGANTTAQRSTLGLGTLATLSSVNNSNWSGTELAIVNGGTGATSASAARTSLGLGSLATLSVINNANWSGTQLAVANGGTGATDASGARTNLGLVIGTDVSAATHTHAAADIVSGLLNVARLGSGTASSSNFLRGDSTWAVPTVTDGDKGDITVTASGATWTIDAGVIGTSKMGGDVTTAGKNLLTGADATAQRTTLGLGTLATLSLVGITEWDGSIIGIDIGGTGADNATDARTNLGLGTLATLSSINNSNWSGTQLAITNGGTGATTNSGARTNLGLGSLAVLSLVTNTEWDPLDPLAIENGGTGASSKADARTNLGLQIGFDIPALSHTHDAGDVTSGTMATARLGSGTASSTTFLRGDQSYATPDHGSIGGLSDDDHTQYILVDGSRSFSAAPSSAVAATTSNHLTRLNEVQAAFDSLTATFISILASYSVVGHTHAASDITSGTMSIARLASVRRLVALGIQ